MAETHDDPPVTAPRRTRPPHEFDESYAGRPPWDIGRPQSVFQALADAGEFHGRFLDAGCGTGEHTLMAARIGLDATGIDFAPAAIALAQGKARERGIQARFLVHDALQLASLDGPFDTILDSGLFHVFNDADRRAYVESLRSAVPSGAPPDGAGEATFSNAVHLRRAPSLATSVIARPPAAASGCDTALCWNSSSAAGNGTAGVAPTA